jgi:hypothetical protein
MGHYAWRGPQLRHRVSHEVLCAAPNNGRQPGFCLRARWAARHASPTESPNSVIGMRQQRSRYHLVRSVALALANMFVCPTTTFSRSNRTIGVVVTPPRTERD